MQPQRRQRYCVVTLPHPKARTAYPLNDFTELSLNFEYLSTIALPLLLEILVVFYTVLTPGGHHVQTSVLRHSLRDL